MSNITVLAAAPDLTLAPPQDITGPILALTDKLIEVIRGESEALREMRVHDIGPLQQEKARLIGLYQGMLGTLKNGTARVSAEAAPQAALRAKTAELGDVSAENEKLLRTSRVATERVLRIIMETLRKHRSTPTGYTASAQSRARSMIGMHGVTVDHRY